MNREDIQTIVEVLAKLPQLDQVEQVLIAGRQQPNVRMDRFILPEPFESLFLEQAQHFALRQSR